MFLVIGLGNPGKQYQNTWHNLGFLVIDEFAKKSGFPDFKNDKWSRSFVSKKDLGAKTVILAKPQTFMNESGAAVKELTKRSAPGSNELIIIHDDADLPIGQIRISKNRGAAGHKGIDSIVRALGTKNFIRVRIGVRPKNYRPGSKSLQKFVLRKFTGDEEKIVAEITTKASEALEIILEKGAEKAMSEHN